MQTTSLLKSFTGIAGFTENELSGMCRAAFGNAESIAVEYYRRLYRAKARYIEPIVRYKVHGSCFPCVYVTGVKRGV